jgi:glycosyltransferase involved in cell wall biosynthesis
MIAARWTHGTRDEAASDAASELESFEGFRFLRIPVNKYKHAHDKKRVFNWLIFAWRLRKLTVKLDEKPDVIIYSSPSLIGYLTAYLLSKRHSARLIFEVRDIWPLTLVKLGGFSKKHPFIQFMQWIEDFAYKKSEHMISNLEGAGEHAISRGLSPNKFTWIPNGFSESELGRFEKANTHISDTIGSQQFSVTYAGAIGEANSLDTLIDAAKTLIDSKGVYFNIVGQGRLVEKLQHKVKISGLSNVLFWGPVPKAQVQAILRKSDVCVICWRRSSLYDHGLAANKLFDYLYSGRPIINAYSGGYDIIQRYKAGLTVPAEDPVALANAIVKMLNFNSRVREEMGINGREAAIKFHEYENIALKLASVVNSNGMK